MCSNVKQSNRVVHKKYRCSYRDNVSSRIATNWRLRLADGKSQDHVHCESSNHCSAYISVVSFRITNLRQIYRKQYKYIQNLSVMLFFIRLNVQLNAVGALHFRHQCSQFAHQCRLIGCDTNNYKNVP